MYNRNTRIGKILREIPGAYRILLNNRVRCTG